MCCYDYDCVICVVMIARILQIYAEGEKNASLPAIITLSHYPLSRHPLSRHNHNIFKNRDLLHWSRIPVLWIIGFRVIESDSGPSILSYYTKRMYGYYTKRMYDASIRATTANAPTLFTVSTMTSFMARNNWRLSDKQQLAAIWQTTGSYLETTL